MIGCFACSTLNCAVARQEKATSMVLFLSSIFNYLFNLLTPDSVCDIVRPEGGGGGGGGNGEFMSTVDIHALTTPLPTR